VLASISGLAIAFSAVTMARINFLPITVKIVVLALAAYGLATVALGIKAGTGYPELFHSLSLWPQSPFWMQGAVVGMLGLVPLAVLFDLVGAIFRTNTRPLLGYETDPLALALCIAIAIAALKIYKPPAASEPVAIATIAPSIIPTPEPSPPAATPSQPAAAPTPAVEPVIAKRPVAPGDVPFGTVMVSAGDDVQERDPDTSALIGVLKTGGKGTTGSVFDSTGNFYVTLFDSSSVIKFQASGVSHEPFGSGFNGYPESIVVDNAGHFYVGSVCDLNVVSTCDDKKIHVFDRQGNPLGVFAPAIEKGERGTDWIDLSSDQCTIFYTSEGTHIKRFDVCNNSQLPDFNSTPLAGSNSYALRLLPGAGLLLADKERVVRLTLPVMWIELTRFQTRAICSR